MTTDATMSLVDDAAAQLTAARTRYGVLTMTVELPADQASVWNCLTDPTRLAQWSPIVPDRALDSEGPATSRENPDDQPVDATVLESRGPWYLDHRWGGEHLCWQLAPSGDGTQVNLVQELSDPQQAADMAAGWHLCLTVLRRQLDGVATPRCVGANALEAGWERLRGVYHESLGDQVDPAQAEG